MTATPDYLLASRRAPALQKPLMSPRVIRWQQLAVVPESPLRDAIAALQKAEVKLLLICGDDRKLLGTLTDGDVRRGLLKGLSLDGPVARAMNASPLVLKPGARPARVASQALELRIGWVPEVDAQGVLLGLREMKGVPSVGAAKPNSVVIMAGGLGSRLGEVTQDTPKSLVEVGSRPILETIVGQLTAHGLTRIFLSVRHRAERIVEHFGAGHEFGADIQYLRETKKLGTAGSLSLLPEIPAEPVIVMNSDLLTAVDFSQLLEFHRDRAAAITVCVREHEFQVPFGVVQMDSDRIVALEEKPLRRSLVSAGIYVLDPDVVRSVPADQELDMPSLVTAWISRERGVSAFPIHEYWLDIGRADDLQRANLDYSTYFDPRRTPAGKG